MRPQKQFSHALITVMLCKVGAVHVAGEVEKFSCSLEGVSKPLLLLRAGNPADILLLGSSGTASPNWHAASHTANCF